MEMDINTNKIKIISLIGMTGVGKTTVGKKLAAALNCGFADLDDIIAERENKLPREIFDIYGEETFRKIESEELGRIISETLNADNSSKIFALSCGGGIVLSEENREMLKKYSYVVWLDRPPEEIIKNADVMKRPPVNGNIDNYIRLRTERGNLYSLVCDIKIEYIDADEACEKIIGELNIINIK